MNTQKEMLEVIKALANGKTVQYQSINSTIWIDADKNILPDFSAFIYRVKPDREYEPYNTIEDFINAQKENGPYFKSKPTNNYTSKCLHLPSSIYENYGKIYLDGVEFSINTEDLLENYVWQNDEVCGKKNN